MFDPISLGLGVVTALPKLYQAYQQNEAADKLKLQDTTTPEQREMLAMARQRAAFGRLPGETLQRSRLAQTQAGALQAASLGAGSGSDLLAASAAAADRRQSGELQLGFQGEQFNQQAQNQLGQQLQMQAQQRQRDLAAYNSQKAALRQGSAENLNNAVNGAAAYAAYGLTNGKPGAAPSAASPEAFDASAVNQSLFAGSGNIEAADAAGYMPGSGALRGGRYGRSLLKYGALNYQTA